MKFATVALSLLLTACAGGGSAISTATTTPFPLPCPTVEPQIALAFPSAGATGISANLSSVVLIYGPFVLSSLNSWGNMQLNGVAQGQLAVPPSPLPSPIATLGPGQVYLAAPIVTPLTVRTTYQVTFAFTNGCGTPDLAAPGAFTTQ
jgi:hypothetical protein